MNTLIPLLLLIHMHSDSYTRIHSGTENSTPTHNMTISECLGGTISKEQYAFLYRVDRVEILQTHQYDDSAQDVFQREPYTVLVRSKLEGKSHRPL